MVAIPKPPRVGDMPKGEPVPEGVYHLRCDKAEYKTASATAKTPGAGMAECQFTIFGPEDAEQFHGRKVFENLMLEGEGRYRLRQLLEATGETEDFMLEDTDQLVGREVAAVIQIDGARKDPATGKQYDARNKVARFLPIEG